MIAGPFRASGALANELVLHLQGVDMREDDEEDRRTYIAVVNHEEQYSIWLADKELPLGWRDAGKRGTKAECLAYIEEVWTDMRPLSLRRKMAEAEGKG
jgi:MbtH protein